MSKEIFKLEVKKPDTVGLTCGTIVNHIPDCRVIIHVLHKRIQKEEASVKL